MPLYQDSGTPPEGLEDNEQTNRPLSARQTTLTRGDASPKFDHPRAIETILYGGLVAGLLGVLDDVVVYSLQGRNPIEFLQFIASGAIGKEAFAGGYGTAALGTAFHFLIAFVTARSSTRPAGCCRRSTGGPWSGDRSSAWPFTWS